MALVAFVEDENSEDGGRSDYSDGGFSGYSWLSATTLEWCCAPQWDVHMDITLARWLWQRVLQSFLGCDPRSMNAFAVTCFHFPYMLCCDLQPWREARRARLEY